MNSFLILHKPVLYQESAQGRIPIEGRFVRSGKTEIAFRVAQYDVTKPLVVDPALEIAYATLFGGSGDETAFGIAVDGGGNAYIAGTTSSAPDFPTLSAAYATYGGGTSDYFVTKFNSTGTALVYSTYLGGSGNETGNPGIIGGIANYTGILAVDPSGNAYVTGYTTSIERIGRNEWIRPPTSRPRIVSRHLLEGSSIHCEAFWSNRFADKIDSV